jgi:hypothetical protein
MVLIEPQGHEEPQDFSRNRNRVRFGDFQNLAQSRQAAEIFNQEEYAEIQGYFSRRERGVRGDIILLEVTESVRAGLTPFVYGKRSARRTIQTGRDGIMQMTRLSGPLAAGWRSCSWMAAGSMMSWRLPMPIRRVVKAGAGESTWRNSGACPKAM